MNPRRLLGDFVLSYLRFFSKLKLSIEKPKIIGIAGASGKSSLALILGEILSDRFKVRQSEGRNSETGIPLSVLGIAISNYSFFSWLIAILKTPFKAFLGKKSDIFIAEMGIDSPVPPKNMDYLLSLIRPQIAVMTNITYEHAVYFEKFSQGKKDQEGKTLDLIAKEELKLLRSLGPENIAVLNMDNEFISGSLPLGSKTIGVSSKDKKSDYFIEEVENSINSFRFNFQTGGKRYSLTLNQPLPNHYSYTFAEAIAVASLFGITIQESIQEIEKNFKLPPGRASVFNGIKDTFIIDSSYNSVASDPLIDFLELTDAISKGRRRLGILGEMREQGKTSKSEHEKVAKKILTSLDFAILIGESMLKFVAPVLKDAKFPHLAFKTFSEAKGSILNEVHEKDVILVKSSQNQLFLERAVELLLKNSEDREKLSRRGEYWDKIRAKTP